MKNLYLKHFDGTITNIQSLKLEPENIVNDLVEQGYEPDDLDPSEESELLDEEARKEREQELEATEGINKLLYIEIYDYSIPKVVTEYDENDAFAVFDSTNNVSASEQYTAVCMFNRNEELPTKFIPFRVLNELPKKKDKRGNERIVTVYGYVEVGTKPNKKSQVRKKDRNLAATLYGIYPVLRNLPVTHKIIGYAKLENSDTYIAIIKRKPFMILWWKHLAMALLTGMVATLILLKGPEITSVVTDIFDNMIPKGQGPIEIEETELPEAETVRIIMNSSLTLSLEDRTMNVYVENNKDSNKYSMVTEYFVLAKTDYDGNELESMNEYKIAQTPVLDPGENITDLPIFENANIEPGLYKGRALITFYRIIGEKEAEPVSQSAGIFSLKVVETIDG